MLTRHSLWTFWEKASSQQYILMNLIQPRISFMSLTRWSVTTTHFLRKYAVRREASICPDAGETIETRQRDRVMGGNEIKRTNQCQTQTEEMEADTCCYTSGITAGVPWGKSLTVPQGL